MHYLFFPLPAFGHVHPMLPLAHELVSRGDDVTVYATDDFATAIRHAGATFRPLPEGLVLPPRLRAAPGGGPTNKDDFVKQMMSQLLGIMRRGLAGAPSVAERARAERADAVVYDPFCPWGRAVATLLGLPAVTFYPTYPMPSSPQLQRKIMPGLSGAPPLRALPEMLALRLVNERLHRKFGLPRMGMRDMFSTTEELNFVPMPAKLHPAPASLGGHFLFVGPSVVPRGDRGDFPFEQLEAGRPTLLVSLGSTPANQRPDFYAACIEAFAATRFQVVLACGKGTDIAALGPVPDHFIVRRFVPQLELLPHVDVFLTHGGMNSTMEALLQGVPLVVFPQTPEQALTARRVTELGLGVMLEPEEALSPETRREVVEAVNRDPRYRERVAAFRDTLLEGGGERRAADALREYVAQAKQRRAAS
jgi:MGT family glycosyltransferase